MIVSHRHRFIFIKTRKTASTSIEIALSQFCGPEDIITPIHPDDEAIRRSLGYPGPQNFLMQPGRYSRQVFCRTGTCIHETIIFMWMLWCGLNIWTMTCGSSQSV